MEKKFILFTMSACPGCVQVKQKLKEKGIGYEERNMTNETDNEQFERMNYAIMSAPSIIVVEKDGGKEVYRGEKCHEYVDRL